MIVNVMLPNKTHYQTQRIQHLDKKKQKEETILDLSFLNNVQIHSDFECFGDIKTTFQSQKSIASKQLVFNQWKTYTSLENDHEFHGTLRQAFSENVIFTFKYCIKYTFCSPLHLTIENKLNSMKIKTKHQNLKDFVNALRIRNICTMHSCLIIYLLLSNYDKKKYDMQSSVFVIRSPQHYAGNFVVS